MPPSGPHLLDATALPTRDARVGPAVSPLLILGFWSIPVLLSATQHIAVAGPDAGRGAWLEALLRPAPGWYLWAGFSLLVLQLGRWVPPDRTRWRRALAVHLPVAAAMALVHIAVLVAANRIGSPLAAEWSWGEQYLSYLSGIFHVDLLIYGAVLGVGHTLESYRSLRSREALAAELRGQLAEARLQALRMQLNPHFLFNTLNAAVTLLRTGESAVAARMLTGLGDLLRRTLEDSGGQEIRLAEELDFLRRYLELEHLRFPDRLRFQLEIPPDLLDARVPSMILQPLVENAVRHGVGGRSRAGRVVVSARRSGALLELGVRDDGPGLPEGWSLERSGIGLRNTRARLETLYPARGGLRLGNAEGGGVAALVTLPYRETEVGP